MAAIAVEQLEPGRARTKGAHRRPVDRRRRRSRVRAGLLLAAVTGGLVVPFSAGWRPYVVESGSMGATAPTGSMVAMRPISSTDVGVGDIVLLHRANGTPVLHRVIERTLDNGRPMVRTKGDANPKADPGFYAVPATTLTPALVVPKVGYAVPMLRSTVGRCVLVALAGLLLITASVRRRPSDAR
jgi:signal peptidase